MDVEARLYFLEYTLKLVSNVLLKLDDKIKDLEARVAELESRPVRTFSENMN